MLVRVMLPDGSRTVTRRRALPVDFINDVLIVGHDARMFQRREFRG
jgi:hypothetical protein